MKVTDRRRRVLRDKLADQLKNATPHDRAEVLNFRRWLNGRGPFIDLYGAPSRTKK